MVSGFVSNHSEWLVFPSQWLGNLSDLGSVDVYDFILDGLARVLSISLCRKKVLVQDGIPLCQQQLCCQCVSSVGVNIGKVHLVVVMSSKGRPCFAKNSAARITCLRMCLFSTLSAAWRCITVPSWQTRTPSFPRALEYGFLYGDKTNTPDEQNLFD